MLRAPRGRADASDGQATVELALVLPLVALFLLAVVQIGLVVRAQVLVTHAAREGARAAAVDPRPDAAREAAVAASNLDPRRLIVERGARGEPGSRVRVRVRYRPPPAVPFVGVIRRGLVLEAAATMHVE